jgi:hypothetical protein
LQTLDLGSQSLFGISVFNLKNIFKFQQKPFLLKFNFLKTGFFNFQKTGSA